MMFPIIDFIIVLYKGMVFAIYIILQTTKFYSEIRLKNTRIGVPLRTFIHLRYNILNLIEKNEAT